MRILPALALCLLPLSSLLAGVASIASNQPPPAPVARSPFADWDIRGHLHTRSVYGGSTGDQAELATAHHDPAVDGYTLQSAEAGLSVQPNTHLGGFATGSLRWDDSEGLVHEFEEGFAAFRDLPGGFTIRAGQFFNIFGIQNFRHQHGWDFLDQNTPHGRFLGIEGLTTRGVELQWKLPIDSITTSSVLSLSYGNAPEHGHGDHGHEEEGHEEGEEEGYEAEGALYGEGFYTANSTTTWRNDDFISHRAGLSGAWGNNKWDRRTTVLGAHYAWQWRENGLELGGQAVRWEAEALWRRAGAVSGHLPGEEEEEHEGEEEEHEGEEEGPPQRAQFEEFGITSTVVYSMDSPWWGGPLDFSARAEYLQGIGAAELDERLRLSAGITAWLTQGRQQSVRLQYNFDDSSSGGQAHGIWLQIGLDWGRPELR